MYTAGGIAKWHLILNTVKNYFGVSYKVKYASSIWPSNSLHKYLPIEMKTGANIYLWMFKAALLTKKLETTRKQINCDLTILLNTT